MSEREPPADPPRDDPHEVVVDRVGFVHRRTARRLRQLAAAAFLVPGAMFAHALIYPAVPEVPASAWADVLGQTSMVAGALLAVSLLVGSMARTARGTLSRVGDRVTAETRRLLGGSALHAISVQAGYIVPAGRRVRAELHLEGGDMLVAETEDDATAEKILHVAGVDASQQRARIPLSEPIAQVIVGVILASLFAIVTLPFSVALLRAASIPAAVLMVWMAVVALVGWSLARRTGAPEVTVGTDGVSYRAGLRRRFIPMSEIEGVTYAGGVFTFSLGGGRKQQISGAGGLNPAQAAALERRVREVLAARRTGNLPAQLELLDRRGRNLSEWTAALSTLARAGSSYRAVGLSADDLAAIVVSPDVTPERRLGAALALQAAGDPAAAERIHTAAAQCASGRLRVALERVGEGAVDHEALEEALAETESAEPPRVARR